MTDRRLLRLEADGRLDLHFDLATLASHDRNDMVVDGAGRARVGNFGFDLHAGADADRPEKRSFVVREPSVSTYPPGN